MTSRRGQRQSGENGHVSFLLLNPNERDQFKRKHPVRL